MDIDAEFSRIISESTASLEPHLRRCTQNLHRVGRLAGISGRGSNEDILRSAVVLLHATMEDCLRSLIAVFLPHAGDLVLNRVPLVGSSTPRPEKFLLGRLASYRANTVDEVIRLSVSEFLESVTFSRVSQIVDQLQPLGFQIDPLAEHFQNLEIMMRRRHQIVHRADPNEEGGLTPIGRDEVIGWANAVTKFLSHVLAQAGYKEAFNKVERLLRDITGERGLDA